mmetsp:Transcript_21093/g.58674  ORF Transcript_21093/g.58674 Transcript_21093/m.58674 type:complete len:290 (-) Transcript_21093:32-901(-)
MKFHLSVLLATIASASTDAFTLSNCRSAVTTQLQSTENTFAAEYLVRAHEDKLRAVAEVEQTKNAEISALRSEVSDLKEKVGALSTTAGSAAPPAVSTDEVATKLLAYQQFMAKYIVEAHQQKVEAVRVAELRITQKYEEQMKLLKPEASAEPAKTEEKKIAAAPPAAKEEQKEAAPAPAPVASSTSELVVPPEVEAADHGLRADGGVGGYTLAERVALGKDVVNVGAAILSGGAEAAPAPAGGAIDPQLAKNKEYFDRRNRHVVDAAKAGKSRWGEMEIARTTNILKN